MEDKDLIIKTQAGDLDEFSELVKRYQGNVRACLAARLFNKHEAEDLSQEAFIVAFRKLDSFQSENAFGPWIRGIAINLLRNHIRKHKPTPVGGAAELETLIDHTIDQGYSEQNASDTLIALRHCIGKLDKPMQELLDLRYKEGFTVGELSGKLLLRHSTLTMRLHRLRDSLRACVSQKLGGYEY